MREIFAEILRSVVGWPRGKSQAWSAPEKPRPPEPQPTTMAGRLGYALEGLFFVLAVLAWFVGWFFLAHRNGQYGLLGMDLSEWMASAIVPAALWAIGRACRYVLAGP